MTDALVQLMGIETPNDLSGAECSFTSAIIAVEELARVDPSVAVLCDVHNTLVNSVLRIYGSDAIKEKWLPDLATNKVSRAQHDCATTAESDARSEASACLSLTPDPTRSVCRPRPSSTRAVTFTS